MTNIAVPIPPSLQKYREGLRDFFAGMVRKLDINSHKNTPDLQQIPDIINLMRAEIEEFEEQISLNKYDPNSLTELQDAANFAFLAFLALRMEGVRSEREELIDEFLDVRPEEGKVYCKKTRSGSQYKVGEEIRGTNRNGYVDIKVQSRQTKGRSLSIPRSHLIWWKGRGVWPTGVIDHQNRNRGDDRISNLRDLSFSENSLNSGRERLLPNHVTIYKPSGRSHLAHYGKYVYQKTHLGKNVRCAYYDTPEEASVQGALDWNRKVGI